MRKVILNLAVSLDGFIEGPRGEYDWCLVDQDYGMTEFLKRVDAIFFGRKSYERLIESETSPYPEKHKYIFSNSLLAAPVGTQLVYGNIKKEVTAIKNQEGKDIWLFGGAGLTTTLLNANLVDELQLSVHPLILGQGKALFAHVARRITLQLRDSKKYPTGLVQLFYNVQLP